MSEYRRFFADVSERDGDTINIVKEYNHIARVLRMKAGDNCFVCFNDGIDHFCEIVSIGSSAVNMKILNSASSGSENSYHTTLFIGALKGDKNEFVVQKAVELGVNKIVFFNSQFTVSKFDDKKIERFNKVSAEASKQCGRASIVPVEYTSLKNVSKQLAEYQQTLVCYERETRNTMNSTLRTDVTSLAIIIGSEGGLSEDEVVQLCDAGAITVTLGRRILRAETAPICVMAIVNNLLTGGN